MTTAMTQMSQAFRLASENLKEARDIQKEYFDKQSEERKFEVGDQVLVFFPNVPVGVNAKFFKRWRGVYTVVKKINRVNLEVSANPLAKSFVVHVNRVKLATEEERRRDSKQKQDAGDATTTNGRRANDGDEGSVPQIPSNDSCQNKDRDQRTVSVDVDDDASTENGTTTQKSNATDNTRTEHRKVKQRKKYQQRKKKPRSPTHHMITRARAQEP